MSPLTHADLPPGFDRGDLLANVDLIHAGKVREAGRTEELSVYFSRLSAALRTTDTRASSAAEGYAAALLSLVEDGSRH